MSSSPPPKSGLPEPKPLPWTDWSGDVLSRLSGDNGARPPSRALKSGNGGTNG